MRFSRAEDWPRIHVVHCGLGEEFRQATPTTVPDVPRLVCVARFVEQKAHGGEIRIEGGVHQGAGIEIVNGGYGSAGLDHAPDLGAVAVA